MRRLLSVLLAMVMACSLVPAPALAEAAEEAEALAQEGASWAKPEDDESGNDEPEEGDPEEVVVQEEDVSSNVAVQDADEDPFWFVDAQTGDRATTLHTSRKYLLKDADGLHDLSTETLYFTHEGADGRGGTNTTFEVPVREASYSNEDGAGNLYAYVPRLEAYGIDYEDWALPSGTYTVGYYPDSDDFWNDEPATALSQTYQVVCDGPFRAFFAGSGEPYHDYGDFAAYAWVDQSESWHDYEDDDTPLTTLPLASDLHLHVGVQVAVDMGEDGEPTLESIGLWKAPGTLAELAEQYGDEDEPYLYAGIDGWPNLWNAGDDTQVVTLWARGDDGDVAFIGNEHGNYDDETGEWVRAYTAGGYVSLDRVNFQNVAGVEDGTYFPVVRASYGDETYTYVYHPIDVSAEGATGRTDPRITTTTLDTATVNQPYAATLAGRSGASHKGEFAWSSDDLPSWLSLDAETGALTGTPTELGTWTFSVTLTETIEGESRQTSQELSIEVHNNHTLELGEMTYAHRKLWQSREDRDTPVTFPVTVPISQDVRNAELDLNRTEVWYSLELTDVDGTTYWYVDSALAADLTTTDDEGGNPQLNINAMVFGKRDRGPDKDAVYITNTASVDCIRVMLLPRHNDGSYAVDVSGIPQAYLNEVASIGSEMEMQQPNESGHGHIFMNEEGMETLRGWSYLPQLPVVTMEKPEVTIGGWIRFSGFDFGVGQAPTSGMGRVSLTPVGQGFLGKTTEVGYLSRSITTSYDTSTAEFAVVPGTYLYTVEAEVNVYDEVGVNVTGSAWADVSGGPSEVWEWKWWMDTLSESYMSDDARQVTLARTTTTVPVLGTTPKQYMVTVGANHLAAVKVNYSTSSIAEESKARILKPRFEQEELDDKGNPVYAEDLSVGYEARWYRRKANDDGTTTDILIATGTSVVLGPSELPLYVEVVPTSSSVSFYQGTGKVRVSDKSKVIPIDVPRKQLFSGTFELSCVSGNKPAAGERWGMIEVHTPMEKGGITIASQWVSLADDAASVTVEVPGLITGSTVTFTPEATLKAGAITYEVTESESFLEPVPLAAPLPDGLVSLEGFTYTDVNGNTQPILLNDGQTDITVEYFYDNNWNSWWEGAPFRVVDGTSIVIEPNEAYYRNYRTMRAYIDAKDNDTATYRMTITHREANAAERLGFDAPDYVVRREIEFQLALPAEDAENQTIMATIRPEEALVSRGYASIELSNPQGMGCELLLYHTNGELVDHGPVSDASQIRTPYLEAGRYTLYAVDSSLVPMTRADDYDTQQKLAQLLLKGQNRTKATSITFDVEDGTITRAERLVFPVWSGTELVDRANSSVLVGTDYPEKLTIRMHAQLAAGVSLGDGAYLEIATNQPSNLDGAGHTNPQALNLNGKAVAINRWTNLFGGTQNMYRGNLRLMLGEVKKMDASYARFPMDMTLVIPRKNMAATEVQIWLVSGSGDDAVRSLVGTYREQVREASIVVPPVAAWKTFGVYGQTAPGASVAVYVDGMRSATTYADNYGFYQTSVTLPDDVRDFEEFSISAQAQWMHGEQNYSAATGVERVLYSTTYPAVECITMCYQGDVGDVYHMVTTYERGYLRSKYRSLYRSEHDNDKDEGADHAKFFWTVEFANDAAERIGKVSMRVPRSDGAVTMSTTDALATASSWIPDVRQAVEAYGNDEAWWHTSRSGRSIYESLTEKKLHTFVSRPTYFTVSPHDLELSFELSAGNEVVIEPMEPASNLGTYEGWRGAKVGDAAITQEQLATYIDAMNTSGYVRLCAVGDSASSYASANDQAASLLGAAAGSVDEWMYVSNGAGDALQLKHRVSTAQLTPQEMSDEVNGRLAAAHKVTDAYEAWLADGTVPADKRVARYEGNMVVDAGGVASTGSYGMPYLIETVAEDGSVQVEAFYQYWLEEDGANTGKLVHHRDRMTKDSWTMTQWNEATGQRVDVTYTLGEASRNETAGRQFADVVEQWYWIQRYVLSSVVAASNELAESGDEPLEGQSLMAQDDGILTVQGFPADQIETLTTWIAKCSGNSTGLLPDETKYPERLDDIRNNPKKDVTHAADPNSEFWKGDQAQAASLGGANNFGEKGELMSDMTTTVGYSSAEAMVGARGGPSTWLGISTFVLPPVRSKFEEGWKNTVDEVNGNNAEEAAKKERKDYETYRADRYMIRYDINPSDDYWRIRATYDRYKLAEWDRQADKDTKNWTWLSKANPDVVLDPSGIVYEAVLSNPVAGATVTLFTFNSAAAAAGFDDPAQFLDSTQFGIEENPQVTGADGHYQWFVPQGYWQIRVEKDGYESMSTGGSDAYGIDATKTLVVGYDENGPQTVEAQQYWMPVLPIQLDVNIGLVSTDTPRVASTTADEGGATVTFSQYVSVASVTAGLFTLGGKAPSSVEAVDAEAAGDGSGVMLARTFRLGYAADAQMDAGASLELTFNDASGKVTNYAKKQVAPEDRVKTDAVEVAEGGLTKVAKPKVANRTYSGKVQVGVAEGKGYVLSGTTQATNAGTYQAKATLAAGYCWADGSRGVAVLSWTIARAKVGVPAAKAGLVYTGKEQVGVATGTGYALAGTVRATGGGSHTAYATPDANHCWPDGSTGRKAIAWKITAAKNTAKAAKISVKKRFKAKALKKKAATVTLPKVTTKFGKAAWKVTTKDKKKVLSLNAKTGKVKVKKGAKKGTYSIKLKASVAKTANWLAASTKVVTVKVTIS